MRNALSVAVLVAGSIIPAAGMTAEPLGRLFFTPAQRSILDAGKHTVARAPVSPGPRTVRLNGVVTRSDAERTIWINGKAYYNGAPDGMQIKTNPGTPGSTSIRLPGSASAARLKVGQQLDLNSGHIEEDYSRRRMPSKTIAAPPDNSAPRAVNAKTPGLAADEATASPDRDGEKKPQNSEGFRGDNVTNATPAAR
jgi:hypothetical protein